MIFIDSNIPMYIVGGEHENKLRARQLLSELITLEKKLVTDVEVIQEILHRYCFINRKDAIQPAIDFLQEIVDETFSIDVETALLAKDLIFKYDSLSSRDAIHLAIMKINKIKTVLSFDKGFDTVLGIERLC